MLPSAGNRVDGPPTSVTSPLGEIAVLAPQVLVQTVQGKAVNDYPTYHCEHVESHGVTPVLAARLWPPTSYPCQSW